MQVFISVGYDVQALSGFGCGCDGRFGLRVDGFEEVEYEFVALFV